MLIGKAIAPALNKTIAKNAEREVVFSKCFIVRSSEMSASLTPESCGKRTGLFVMKRFRRLDSRCQKARIEAADSCEQVDQAQRDKYAGGVNFRTGEAHKIEQRELNDYQRPDERFDCRADEQHA